LDLGKDLPNSDIKLTNAVVENYFQEYSDRLQRYAFTILRDDEDAKDAVQAVFLKLWEKGEALDSEKSIKSYLYTSVHNHCLNVKRHQKVKDRHVATSKEPTTNMDDRLSRQEDRRQIEASLNKLPPQCRRIFIMSRVEEKKYAEIAAELGISVKTVEVQMGKALKILRNKLFGSKPLS
jgi:RNA polymerase sigma-70 factor (ECF subfamily)